MKLGKVSNVLQRRIIKYRLHSFNGTIIFDSNSLEFKMITKDTQMKVSFLSIRLERDFS